MNEEMKYILRKAIPWAIIGFLAGLISGFLQ